MTHWGDSQNSDNPRTLWFADKLNKNLHVELIHFIKL